MEDFYEHIDDYMNGLLSSEALAQFKVELGRNESLRIAVENYDAAKAISEGLLEVDMMETLQGLAIENAQILNSDEAHSSKPTDDVNQNLNKSKQNSINSEKSSARSEIEIDRSKPFPNHPTDINNRSSFSNPKSNGKRFSFRKLAVAASVIGLLCVGGWWMMGHQAEQERKSYVLVQIQEQGLIPKDPDAVKSVRREEDLERSAFQNGKYYYSLNRFEESIKWLELVVSEEKNKKILSEGHYWLGHAYIQMWRVADAKRAWEKSDEVGAEKGLSLLDQ